MAAQPQPAPAPSGGGPDVSSLVAAAGALGSSTSTTAGEYGLDKDAASAAFNLAGLPGLTGQGSVDGNTLLNLFLAAGQSTNQQSEDVAAAIQHALYLSGYYGSTVPDWGVIKGSDASVLAKALNDLNHVNSASATINVNAASGDQKPQAMPVASFLSSQAAVGVAHGAGAALSSVAPTVVNLRAPNAADLASTFEKTAQATLGRKPTGAETQAFVQAYTQSYVANEKANAVAQYNASVAKAQAKTGTRLGTTTTVDAPAQPPVKLVSADTSPPLTPAAAQHGPNTYTGGSANAADFTQNGSNYYAGGSANAAEFQQNGSTAGSAQPDSLIDSMQTLQDILGQNTGQGSDPGLIFAGTNVPEAADVAAENFARNADPKEAAANDLGNTMQNFLNLVTTKLV